MPASSESSSAQPITPKKVNRTDPWEVRDYKERLTDPITYVVQRGTHREGTVETAAREITDYGLACVIEAACNMRDGTTE